MWGRENIYNSKDHKMFTCPNLTYHIGVVRSCEREYNGWMRKWEHCSTSTSIWSFIFVGFGQVFCDDAKIEAEFWQKAGYCKISPIFQTFGVTETVIKIKKIKKKPHPFGVTEPVSIIHTLTTYWCWRLSYVIGKAWGRAVYLFKLLRAVYISCCWIFMVLLPFRLICNLDAWWDVCF